jgi:uncharacterized RDD family membrane protein YckC
MEVNFKISDFWSRVGAVIIDGIILGILGLIIGLTLEAYLVKLGNYGYLIGLGISLVYFTIFNSKIFNGQTLGKRTLNIQVVDIKGNMLGFGKTLLRSTILLLPYFIVNHTLPGIIEGSVLYFIKIIVLTVIIFSIILIYIFNKGNRQSLHDLLVGSYVISVKRVEVLNPKPLVSKSSLYITGALILLLLVSSLLGYSHWSKDLSDITTIQKSLYNLDNVLSVGVSKNKTTFYGNGGSTSYRFIVRLWVTDIPDNTSELEKTEIVRQSIKQILLREPEFDKFDDITVVLMKGFDIGIARKSRSSFVGKSPAEWRELIE